MVPHLVTASGGPINEFEQRLLDAMPAIERWFRLEWMEHTPPFYCSVDLRNAGFKLAPLATDLFPSHWNHLSAAMLPLAVQAAMAAIEKICPEARNLLIIPHNAIQGTAYLSNLARLRHIFLLAGLNVRFGSINPALKKPASAELPGGDTITVEPAVRNRTRLGVKQFDPCTILLNNDLRAGVPGILEELHEQFLLPPLQAGWSTRRNTVHLKCFEEVAKRFGKLIGIDPWLINPMFDACGVVDLADAGATRSLVARADAMLGKVRKKYKEFGIKEKPFVVIKRNDALNGMGLMTLRDTRDFEAARTRLLATWAQSGEPSSYDLLVQEGVQTHERVHDRVAEPVVYMMDRYVVGGYYRLHAERAEDESLLGHESTSVPLAFAEGTELPHPGARAGASAPNRFYMYGVVARLAMLAASYELEATHPDDES